MQVRGSQDQRDTYSNISNVSKVQETLNKYTSSNKPHDAPETVSSAGRKEVRNSQDTEIHKLIM